MSLVIDENGVVLDKEGELDNEEEELYNGEEHLFIAPKLEIKEEDEIFETDNIRPEFLRLPPQEQILKLCFFKELMQSNF